jgi:hypothetical protein
MDRRILPAVFMGVIVALSLHGQAAQQDPFLVVYYNDAKTVLCREYMTSNGARLATYQWWLVGFVSGAAYTRTVVKLPVARVEAADAVTIASDYCRANPNSTLAQAAMTIAVKLGPTGK